MPRFRAWLRNEVWRHLISGVLVMVAAFIVLANRLQSADSDQDAATAQLVALLWAYGLYGPFYLLLTRIAFRGLRGTAFRDALRRTRPPRRMYVQLLIGQGAVSWSLAVTFFAGLGIAALLATDLLSGDVALLFAAVLSVVGAWVLLLAAFAVEYARAWADRDDIVFPDDDRARTLSDFVYLSAQFSTTFGSGDAQLRSTQVRRIATVHAITAFAFSTLFIALLVAIVITRLA